MKRLIKKIIWRLKNRHNQTSVVSSGFPLGKVLVGDMTYGPINAIAFGAPDEFLRIGNYCSIADNVTFLLGGGHRTDRIFTYPFKAKIAGSVEAITKGPIVVEDDVWIGYGATIMSGVHIGKGAVIGACALVNKDVAPFEIVGGVPAKKIGDRFDNAIKTILAEIDYRTLDVQRLRDNIQLIEEPASSAVIDALFRP